MIQKTRFTRPTHLLAAFFLRLRHHLRHGLRKGAKRMFDITCGSLVILMLSPLLITAALIIVIVDGRPVTFAGKRVGILGRLFPMMKFRTMRRDAEAIEKKIQEHKISKTAQHFVDPEHESVLKLRKALLKFSDEEKYPNDPRILPFGKFMRKFSIDELPQLFHIVNGDMSLVGPRPFAMWEVAEFTPRDLLRHKIKPGLTGLWQISNRSKITHDEAIGLDLKYAARQSFWLDLKILLMTVPVALKNRGGN
jgi:lipopolysaccharide/colanic/teichoic acid biosynthesis glycosyltransferase